MQKNSTIIKKIKKKDKLESFAIHELLPFPFLVENISDSGDPMYRLKIR